MQLRAGICAIIRWDADVSNSNLTCWATVLQAGALMCMGDTFFLDFCPANPVLEYCQLDGFLGIRIMKFHLNIYQRIIGQNRHPVTASGRVAGISEGNLGAPARSLYMAKNFFFNLYPFYLSV